MSVDVRRTWTRADLAVLPDDGLRYELVDGSLVVTPPPAQRHHWWAHSLAVQLRAGAPDGWWVVTELSLPLGENLRIPDVVVHRWPLLSPEPDVDNPLGPQDVGLLVEVVSPRTRTTDRFSKPGEYAAAGVGVFWRLETEPVPALHPYELVDGVYVAHAVITGTGAAPSPWGEMVVELGGQSTALGNVRP